MGKPYDVYKHYTLVENHPGEFNPPDFDVRLQPAVITVHPTDEKYNNENQQQRTENLGVIRTKGGRIYRGYFSANGHADENTGNWVIVMTSDDEGRTYQNMLAIDPPNLDNSRVFESQFMLDSTGTLWIFYVQTYRRMDGLEGIWVIKTSNPDDETPVFTAPERLCDGIISSAPVVLKDGRIMFQTYHFTPSAFHGDMHDDFDTTNIRWDKDHTGVTIHVSKDGGKTFEIIATQLEFPYSTFEENCIVEKQDGTLCLYVRGMNCTGLATSTDGGYTWSPLLPNPLLPLPNTHFDVIRLKSGRFLMICNYKANMFSYFIGRNHLTALLSDDEGKSWKHSLLLDEREGAEQPSVYEADNGMIYVAYGRAPQFAGESLMAIITEEDILAGKLVNPKSRLKISWGRALGMYNLPWTDELKRVAAENNIEM